MQTKIFPGDGSEKVAAATSDGLLNRKSPLLTKSKNTMKKLSKLLKPKKSKKPKVPNLAKIYKLPLPVLGRIFDSMSVFDVISTLPAVSRWIRYVVQRWITANVIKNFQKDIAVMSITCFEVNGGLTRRAKFSITDTTVSIVPYRPAPRAQHHQPPVLRNDYDLDEISFFGLRLHVAEGYWDSCYNMPNFNPDLPMSFNNYRIVSQTEDKMMIDVTCAYHGFQSSRRIFRPEIHLRLNWKFDPEFTPIDYWTLQWIELDLADLFTFPTPWL
jgi:hypothetical protein